MEIAAPEHLAQARSLAGSQPVRQHDPAPLVDGRHWRLRGESAVMHALRADVAKVAPLRVAVLIAGESGTGKELVAAEIHARSGRTGAFVPINCAAIPETLFASELFGHERGSFTGAMRRHHGHFERSQGGTIFLDEVTEMPHSLQATLLRVLETGTFSRVGGETEMPLDIRVLASTNRDAKEAVKAGALREDLYYRLSEFVIPVPPLRVREDDIELLAREFLAELNEANGTKRRITSEQIAKLRDYAWPGNVRELRHAVQRAYVLADGIDAPLVFNGASAREATDLLLRPGMSIHYMEHRLIDITLEHFHGDKRATAKALGISLRTLYNRLNEYRSTATRL